MTRLALCALSTLVLLQPMADARADPTVDLYLNHRLALRTREELQVTLSVYNRGKAPLPIVGEPCDGAHHLVLSGDWGLVLEQVSGGRVVWSRDLRPAAPPTATRGAVPGDGHRDWSWRSPLAAVVGKREGSFRLRLSLGQRHVTGRLFRVGKTLAPPGWVSLRYTPDRKSYLLGEPITVRFVMENRGKDAFHFEEGGDYRGASRHLRWSFEAVGPAGAKAVDPKPEQPCFGGLGMSDPHLDPGKSYTKELPLLAYLRFPGPGEYTVSAYQDLGFGEPVPGPSSEQYHRALGGRFKLTLRLPTAEEARGQLRTLLAAKEDRLFRASLLYHPSYLAPLTELLAAERDAGRVEALLVGIGSVMTVEGTRLLLKLAADRRPEVRLAALRQLGWRLPDQRDVGTARPDGPFVFHSREARRRDIRAAWSEALRAPVKKLLLAGLRAAAPEEVAACGFGLGALGEKDAVEALAAAADRLAPGPRPPEQSRRAVEELASAAALLAQLGAAACRADRRSSPGRLAVWANMVRTKQELRRKGWEELELHLLGLESPLTRMAAIRWLPGEFSQGDRVPWAKLFAETDRQIWWHAVQVARQLLPLTLRTQLPGLIKLEKDAEKRGSLEELLRELHAKVKP